MARSRWTILGLTVACTCLLGGLVFVMFFEQDKPLPSPQSNLTLAKNTADFNVYIPQKLPRNYTLNESSSTFSNTILTYTVTNSDGHKATITQQAKPQQIDINSFSGLRFVTELGKASIVTSEGTFSAAIVTKDNVLILITAPEDFSYDGIKAVINSLQTL